MFQLMVFSALICTVLSAPSIIPPHLAPAVVTAQSSQVIARNYNALAAPILAPAPIVAAHPAPVVRAIAPAPLVQAAAPALVGAPYYGSPYVASPYAAGPFVL